MQWLPHLENAVPTKGYGNRLSMYLISLEAWRRGLKVKYYSIDNPENKMLIRYSLSDGKNTYHFESSRGEKLSKQAFEICENKDETKKTLAEAGIPVPEGKRFKENSSEEEILEYAEQLGFPVVIKPISENAGKGVFSNLSSKQDVKNALKHVRHELNYTDIIVEKHIEGIEHRIFVVDGKVHGVVNRIPANIVGDGKNSIKQLINMKNKSKRKNPNIASKLIKIDKEVIDSITDLGYTLDSIPPKGKRIFLRSKSNVSTGGDPIEVTDELSEELKELAVKATNAVPGLDVCGLDMIVDKENNTGVIIEINTKPMIGLHVFPVEGNPRDVVSPILDYYFPETKNSKKTNLYFDFEAAIAPIRNRLVNEIEILPPPTLEFIKSKNFLVSGTLVNEDFRNAVRLFALKNNLHGFVKEIEEQKVQIVIGGKEKDIQEFKKHFINNDSLNIVEEQWNKPIQIGFHNYSLPSRTKTILKLRDSLEKERSLKEKSKEKYKIVKKQKIQITKKLKKQIKQKDVEIENLKNEKIKLEEKLNNILKSTSWKLTKPLRKANKIFKTF